MRISYLSVIALSSISLASPVLDRRANGVSLLTELHSTIRTFTGAINATLAPLSASSSSAEKAVAVKAVGVSFSSITNAIHSTSSSVKALTPGCHVKRSSLDQSINVSSQPIAKRQLAELGVLLAAILVELFATISAAVTILGLGGLLVFLNPLASALSVLILGVEVLVDALLIGVIALLDTLLTGLALGLAGL